jgi:hypothetical protein
MPIRSKKFSAHAAVHRFAALQGGGDYCVVPAPTLRAALGASLTIACASTYPIESLAGQDMLELIRLIVSDELPKLPGIEP